MAVALGRVVPSTFESTEEAALEPEINAFNVVVYVNLTVVFTKLEKYDRAMNYVNKVRFHSIVPVDKCVLNRVSFPYRGAQALAIDPKHLKARFHEAKLLVLSGDVDTAMKKFQALVDDASSSSDPNAAAVAKSAKAQLKRTTLKVKKLQREADRKMAAAMARSMRE